MGLVSVVGRLCLFLPRRRGCREPSRTILGARMPGTNNAKAPTPSVSVSRTSQGTKWSIARLPAGACPRSVWAMPFHVNGLRGAKEEHPWSSGHKTCPLCGAKAQGCNGCWPSTVRCSMDGPTADCAMRGKGPTIAPSPTPMPVGLRCAVDPAAPGQPFTPKALPPNQARGLVTILEAQY